MWIYLLIVCGLLVACGEATPVRDQPTKDVEPTVPVPSLRFVNPPTLLCRDATQLRLRPIVEGAWPADTVATWEVRPGSETTVVAKGTWTLKERDLFVALPDGAPLVPGDYVFTLYVNAVEVVSHTFTVQGTAPRLKDVSLALTPAGPTITDLETLPRIFYLRYAYEAVCPGAPLWVTIMREDEKVFNRNLALQTERGEDYVACYLDNGTRFEPGTYEAVLTLVGGEEARLTFHLEEAPPAPEATQTPIAQDPICGAPSVAMGLTPDGRPFRPLERFEWYTQAVYVIAECRDLPQGLRWIARWYRNGEEIRVHRGEWEGDETGILWDSLTGTEEAPFLNPGTYTTTLSIGSQSPLKVGFRVVPYAPQE
jgi:hypothetical protein